MERLRGNLARYNETGLAGYVVAGSTGEAGLLTREERLALFAAAREGAPGKVLFAGTGVESVRDTIALTRSAADLGYDAALVLTPHYYRAQMQRPETQVEFYRAVADASPIPVFVYSFPQMTGIEVPVEAIARIAEHPNVVGIKESSADLARIEAVIRGVPAGFAVWVGSSVKFHDCLVMGARGGILAIANALPEAAMRVWERFAAGDVHGSREAQATIVEAAGVGPRFGIPGLKCAMDRMGLYGGPARRPLLPLDEGQKAEVARMFRGWSS